MARLNACGLMLLVRPAEIFVGNISRVRVPYNGVVKIIDFANCLPTAR